MKTNGAGTPNAEVYGMDDFQVRRMVHAWGLYRAAMRRSWRLVPTLVYYVLHNEDMCLGGWWCMEEPNPANDNER